MLRYAFQIAQNFARGSTNAACLCSRLISTSSSSSNEVTDVKDAQAAPSNWDTASLERFSSIIYTKPDQFYAHLKKSQSDVSTAANLIMNQLGDEVKELLMQKMYAASGAKPTPSLLAWISFKIVDKLKREVASYDDATLQAQPYFVDMFEAATRALSSLPNYAKFKTKESLVRAYVESLPVSYHPLAQLASWTTLLASVSATTPKLQELLLLLGINVTALSANQKTFAEARSILDAVSLSTELQVAAVLGQETGIPVQLMQNLTERAKEEPKIIPKVISFSISLALIKLLQGQLGIQSQPELQVVTNLLGLSSLSPLPDDLLKALMDLSPVTDQLLKLLPKKGHAPLISEGPDAVQQWVSTQFYSASKGPLADLQAMVMRHRTALLVQGDALAALSASKQELEKLDHGTLTAIRARAQSMDLFGGNMAERMATGQPSSYSEVTALPQADKHALLWCAHVRGLTAQVAGNLTDALRETAMTAHRQADIAEIAWREMSASFQLEQDASIFNLMSLEGPPQLELGPYASPLPSPEDLAAARAALPADEQLLFDTIMDGSKSNEEVMQLFETLSDDFLEENDSLPSFDRPDLPESWRDWLIVSKAAVNKLSPMSLSLLGKFLDIKIRVSKSDIEGSVAKLRMLLVTVMDQMQPEEEEEGSSQYAASAYSTNSEVVADLSPDVLEQILGPAACADFTSWLRLHMLHASEPGQLAASGDQPYELLAAEHSVQNIERYLKMEHDPKLHISIDPAPLSWRDPRLEISEADWLEEMRPTLQRYLLAMGLRPLEDLEWETYKEYAIEEFSNVKATTIQKARVAGSSGLFNTRAETMILKSLLEEGIAEGTVLYSPARKYLSVILANPTWTFAQRRHFIRRLIELNNHFLRYPESIQVVRGSPFGALFKKDGPPIAPSWSDTQAEIEEGEIIRPTPEYAAAVMQ